MPSFIIIVETDKGPRFVSNVNPIGDSGAFNVAATGEYKKAAQFEESEVMYIVSNLERWAYEGQIPFANIGAVSATIH